jgi:hypothetical protein
MGWMSWQDFDVDSALQRDTLGRALRLVETESAEDWGDRINMADPHDPGLTTVLVDSIVNGATPESCIDLLQLRPLLFGTAWTVLDLLLELVGGHRKGEPGSTIEQPVDVGSIVIDDVVRVVADAGDATTQMVDVSIKRGKIGAVVTVVPGAVHDAQWIQQLGGNKHDALQQILPRWQAAWIWHLSHRERRRSSLSSWLSWSWHLA